MDIKTPAFDQPVGIGATGKGKTVDAHAVSISEGMRVALMYQGKQMTAQIVEVESANSPFVARVLGFEDSGLDEHGKLQHGDLQHGDLFHFQRGDLRWID